MLLQCVFVFIGLPIVLHLGVEPGVEPVEPQKKEKEKGEKITLHASQGQHNKTTKTRPWC